MKNAEEREKAYKGAMRICQNDCMELISSLLKSTFVRQYLIGCGMNSNDRLAVDDKTLRGQDVAKFLYRGMLSGLAEGLERLDEQDNEYKDLIRKFADTVQGNEEENG